LATKEPLTDLWQGHSYVPFKPTSSAETPWFIEDDMQVMGSLDSGSIMIYLMVDPLGRVKGNIMDGKNGEVWGINTVPSPGNIAAVKRLYLDMLPIPPMPTRDPPPPPPPQRPPPPIPTGHAWG
jgi:hypothetical protein